MEIKRINNTKVFIAVTTMIILCIIGLSIYKNYWVNAQEVKTTYLHFSNESVSSELLSEDGAIEFAGEALECTINQDDNAILLLKNGSYEVKTVDNNRNITKITITGCVPVVESIVDNNVEEIVVNENILEEVETILAEDVVSGALEDVSEEVSEEISEVIPAEIVSEIEEINGWVLAGNNTYVWENPNGSKSVSLNCITPNEHMLIQSIEIVYVETNEPVKACEHDGRTFDVCPMCGVDLGPCSKNIADLIEGEQLTGKIALYNDAGDLTVQYYDYESDVMSGQLLTAALVKLMKNIFLKM